MEIKVGDYVRLNNGNIGKVVAIKDEETIMLDNEKNRWVAPHCIKKYNENLIDIIELGDIVNGEKVMGFTSLLGEYPLIDTTEDFISMKKIKTIVTHEQIKGMEYKV